MEILANIVIAVVTVAHIGFLTLEMFFWDHPTGRKIFRMTPEQSAFSQVLAANQGLYNGFLAAGLIWGLIADNFEVKIFFLACVVVAGLFGGATANRRIWFIQALPAAIALALVHLAH